MNPHSVAFAFVTGIVGPFDLLLKVKIPRFEITAPPLSENKER